MAPKELYAEFRDRIDSAALKITKNTVSSIKLSGGSLAQPALPGGGP